MIFGIKENSIILPHIQCIVGYYYKYYDWFCVPGSYLRDDHKIKFRMVSVQHFITEAPCLFQVISGPLSFSRRLSRYGRQGTGAAVLLRQHHTRGWGGVPAAGRSGGRPVPAAPEPQLPRRICSVGGLRSPVLPLHHREGDERHLRHRRRKIPQNPYRCDRLPLAGVRRARLPAEEALQPAPGH